MSRHVLDVETRSREELRDITGPVSRLVQDEGLDDGLCAVYCSHTTCGLTINENADPDVKRDILHALCRFVPREDPAYRHAEGNSAAHVKASLMGFSLLIPISGRTVALGRWQGIYLCEFDGPRRRRLYVDLMRS
ncbi:MAG TPA: secondary thiamine-phosphate synthase enzyme YjbQ [Chloroflexota bacterium]|nr:secondary thiamine-phosphate synthase enzyme YjbQ [Chloroflexota bacterium]